jgi:Spy/CpxP family protein refolding chaperone
MTSTQRRCLGTASRIAVTCLALLGCGGQGTTAGGAAAAPAPSASVATPAPQPSPAAQLPSAAPSIAPPTAQAPANPQGAELAEGDEHRGQHHGGVLGLVVMSIKDLDLSGDQQAAVEKIRAEIVSKMEPARAAGKDLGNTLADGVAAGKIDRAKVDLAINKIATQAQGLHEASLTGLNQLHAALTAQQRAKLVDNLQAHWERWKEAQGRDEADDQVHRSGHLLVLVRQLGVTQEQAEKIKASFRDKMKASPQDHAHKDVQDHLQAFATAFKSDTFDAKKLTGAKVANGQVARWGATRMARFIEAATPVLTPEQRTKLAGILRDRANKSDT